LLNIVHYALLEIGCVVAKQTDSGCGLLDDGLVPGTDCACQILRQERDHALFDLVRHRASLFLVSTNVLARPAIRNAFSNKHMPFADRTQAQSAHTPADTF
jgi:hypothetical protein